MLYIIKNSIILIIFLSIGTGVCAQDSSIVIKTGHIDSSGLFKLLYVPIAVPAGITKIEVKESYNESGNPDKNVLNMGIYDPRGYTPANPLGFRGWSGGAKKEFFIQADQASTGYIPGKIQKGLWNILIYPSTIIPAGIDWKLEVKLIAGKDNNEFKVSPTPKSINNKPGWYRGDLHTHTLHSDGKRTQQELIDEAKEKHLDFIISTEHNTNSANISWGLYNTENLLIINGEEVTSTQYGHWNAIGLNADTYIDWRFTPEQNRIGQMISKVHNNGGLSVINHPFFNVKYINSFYYDADLFDCIEVWNGTWNGLNDRALKWWDEQLRQGKKKIAIGASDTHKKAGSPNYLGVPQTVVYASGLSKNAIINGIKQGKAYVTSMDDMDINLSLTAESQNVGLGDTLLLKAGQRFNILLRVKNCPDTIVTLHSALGILKTIAIKTSDESINWKLNGDAPTFLRVEVRNAQGDLLALTNPAWLNIN
ncbi:secreted protein [Arcticibacter svalbardensis MN12-7]|uniref:Secreted protein n=1 Tax=Arcticibacter svalbardensis MN12-7 TaxID=1150600 RepID=R9GWR6_9SPHI|nr:CehA/McbA family metallohydrolase [Arcticibacter svalbardensis]EOR96176.1 secreted protein [Arcticibacter svalbardensis MN12-7]